MGKGGDVVGSLCFLGGMAVLDMVLFFTFLLGESICIVLLDAG